MWSTDLDHWVYWVSAESEYPKKSFLLIMSADETNAQTWCFLDVWFRVKPH